MSSIFFVGPVTTLRNSSQVAKKAESVTEPMVRLAQRAGVPITHDPELLVKINAGAQLLGAAALATGRCPRAAAGLLAVTLVPTTLAGHRFWEESDPAARAQQQLQFAKNLSLLGGLMIAAMDTEGKPGKAWLARQAAKRLSKKADHLASTARLEAKIAALEAAGAGDTLAETLTTAGKAAREHAQGLGDRISEKAPEWAATASAAGALAAAKSADLGSRLAETTSEKAPGWAAAGKAAGSDLLAKSQDVGSRLAETASDKAPELAAAGLAAGAGALARSQDLGSHAADALDELREQGRARAKDLRKEARGTAKELRKELRKEWRSASKDARKEMAKQAKKARKNTDSWKSSAKREVAKAKAKVA